MTMMILIMTTMMTMMMIMTMMMTTMMVSTEDSFCKLPAAIVPELQRSDMAPVILQLKALGISNLLRFNFLSVSFPLL